MRETWLMTTPSIRHGAVGATVAACLGLGIYTAYLRLQPDSDPRKPARSKVIEAETRLEDASVPPASPYSANAFPGGRDVVTAYGSIRVYEWGPEGGERVVLLHGIGTPCVALGEMAGRFVARGCRVMLFDLFGRGYSDAPADLPYDDRLYTTQLLLALASSPLPWTSPASFHLVGYSLGGALAASVAAYHPYLLHSLTLVCPGGLVRPSHVSWRSRLLYSTGLLPEALLSWLARRRLEPSAGSASADVPDVAVEAVSAGPGGLVAGGKDEEDEEDEAEADVDFDDVRVTGGATVGEVVRWQLRGNRGFVPAYMSTIRYAPIYGHHNGLWGRLAAELAARRGRTDPPCGLEGGRVCLVLGEKDPIVRPDEWIEDAEAVLGADGVDVHVVSGGHEIAISKGRRVADIAMESWEGSRVR